ncbi:hypothetical protein [Latilactobacillus fuchuensis]|uniref:hypothetical protein n=1 Tax=Latilactobacillus fuchuensis TaxID=164393 RepID=UPI000AFEBE6D|nr:hypothetical protein [Latilactobacillus fuchuensis]
MTEENWLQQQIQQLQSQATTYEDQAFYQALGQVSHELAQRIEQRKVNWMAASGTRQNGN